jgi:hypothetical protein
MIPTIRFMVNFAPMIWGDMGEERPVRRAALAQAGHQAIVHLHHPVRKGRQRLALRALPSHHPGHADHGSIT